MKYLRLSFGLILFFVESAAIAQRASNWRAFRVADGLPESACMSVTISSPGRVVVRHLDKAFVSQLDGYTITTEPAPPLGMSRVYASPGGQLWSLSPTGLQELREGEWLTHPVKEIAAVSAGKTIDPVSLCAIKQGVVLMLLPEALIEFNAENPALAKTIVIRTVERTQLGVFTGMGLAKDGGLWVAGSRGLAKLPGPLRALKP